ncbi:hypothetical protein SAMN05421812_105167 [Asanoa hainanensis]|uniref:Peptidase inhibitor family I36 n=1 Tax=Asanoa hainanensis TaxID=560556 RepID=A0A239M626_9ACTN|nr:hypothetical protein [Asanoa hainanensis]SNT38156.1 hypothetical protein SAMN05421812_105167 [Asanoa hainanensis]
MKPRGRSVIVLVALATLLMGIMAVPAQAAEYRCGRTAINTIACWVGYQTYPPGTSGLRSSMQGWADGPNIGITARQQNGADEIVVQLKVWDLNEDGYRARVWVDIFQNCHCTNDAYRPQPGRVMDAFNNSGTVPPQWHFINSSGLYVTRYTVRLYLGRYQNSTGNFNRNEEQTYYLEIY